MYDSTEKSLSTMASFLVYISQHGTNSKEFVHSICNHIHFIPLITNLFLLSHQNTILVYQLLSITSSMFILTKYLFSNIEKNEEVLFHVNETVAYFIYLFEKSINSSQTQSKKEGELEHISILQKPFLKNQNHQFDHSYLQYLDKFSCKNGSIGLFEPDYEGKVIAPSSFQNPQEKEMKTILENKRFLKHNKPMDIQNYSGTCFVDMNKEVGLVLRKQSGSTEDIFHVYQPSEAKASYKTLDNIVSIAAGGSSNGSIGDGTQVSDDLVKQLIFVLVDISGSMTSRVEQKFQLNGKIMNFPNRLNVAKELFVIFFK